ncbi:MAG: hypothetical protein R6V46_17740 [Desulfatiglandaceae bacterium]
MNQDTKKDELQTEIKRGNFSRAVLLAESTGLPEAEIRELRMNALWRISAVFRNAPGTRRLAHQYGFSKKDVSEFLKNRMEEMRNRGDDRVLEPCYDHTTTRYLSFEEWLEGFLKNWDKLSKA